MRASTSASQACGSTPFSLAASFWATRAYLSQFPEPVRFTWEPSALVALGVLGAFALVIAAFGLRLARLRPSEALRVT